ncbi:hypothetical protein NMY22_g17782 [Coprinellus aureogranulatus]|nr:hypothetical protein NMY22_g17782 [Coprinellus aureogranulatus]
MVPRIQWSQVIQFFDREREREPDMHLARPAMGGPGGHQIHPDHPYFGQGRNGSPANVYPPPSSHPQEPSMGSRRSPSPPLAPNGYKHRDSAPAPGTWLCLIPSMTGIDVGIQWMRTKSGSERGKSSGDAGATG